jgi:transmembrane sensor
MQGEGAMPSDTDRPSRQDEAAAWFAAERAGVMLVEQRAAFDAWRADPRNQAALDAMRELWDDLAVLKGAAPEPAASAPRPTRTRGRLAAMAALVLLVIGASGTAWWLLQPGPASIVTVAGQQKSQSLPDGSVIAVNVASTVAYDISDKERSVTLAQGEAAFSVRADPARPFVVRTGDYEIRAVGTAFNVRQRDGVIDVAVSEGKVEICRAAGAAGAAVLTRLAAGELLRFPATFSPATFDGSPKPVPVGQISEWRMRIVTYEDAPVSEVIEDFNRYFDQKLTVEDADLRKRRVTVRLRVDDRVHAIETLASLLDARLITLGASDILIAK